MTSDGTVAFETGLALVFVISESAEEEPTDEEDPAGEEPTDEEPSTEASEGPYGGSNTVPIVAVVIVVVIAIAAAYAWTRRDG